MSSVLRSGLLSPAGLAAHARWLPVLVGLAVLYLPTFYDLNRTLWNEEEHAHGPIVLLVVLWLVWQKREVLFAGESAQSPGAGWAALGTGLVCYALGRSQSIILFEVGSLIPVLAGVVLLFAGWQGLRRMWFALVFIAFMLPLPGMVVDALTGSLKQHVSVIAEDLLYALGYPIARTGVVLTIGQYQLLVADACSGLNSMFSLSAMGLLYLYLRGYPDWRRNALLIASIIPIAFVANIVRVVILVLVTYHFGDEAGQGFVHGMAGIVLFVLALSMLFALDGAYGYVVRPRRTGA